MNDSKQAIEVIDAICEKVGIVCNSAQEFIPKLAQHNIVSGAFCMIIELIFIVVGVLVFSHGKKIEKSYDWDIETSFWACIGGAFVAVVASIFFFAELHGVIMWAMFPDVEAVTYILNAIGG